MLSAKKPIEGLGQSIVVILYVTICDGSLFAMVAAVKVYGLLPYTHELGSFVRNEIIGVIWRMVIYIGGSTPQAIKFRVSGD